MPNFLKQLGGPQLPSLNIGQDKDDVEQVAHSPLVAPAPTPPTYKWGFTDSLPINGYGIYQVPQNDRNSKTSSFNRKMGPSDER